MNPAWHTHLRSHHAIIENNHVIHFGNMAAELSATRTDTIMTDLSHFGLIRFSGEDAQPFLQGQLSCDVREISLQKAQYGSYCTPKGRMLASFLLWQHHDDCFMQLPASLLASVQKRLSLFVLRSKVQITDASDTWIQMGIAGQHVAALFEEITGLKLSSDQPMHIIHTEKVGILCFSQHRMQLITSTENAPALWERLSQYAKPVGIGCWDWLNIRSGIPIILPETQEAFLPQMVNLDAIGGIGFKKGCYPGQEIVARTQYLGKLKRRMFLAHIATTQMIQPGDALYSMDMEDQSSGNIVNAAPSPCGGFDVLAVIQQSSAESHEIHWRSLNGPALDIQSLPYSLNT